MSTFGQAYSILSSSFTRVAGTGAPISLFTVPSTCYAEFIIHEQIGTAMTARFEFFVGGTLVGQVLPDITGAGGYYGSTIYKIGAGVEVRRTIATGATNLCYSVVIYKNT